MTRPRRYCAKRGTTPSCSEGTPVIGAWPGRWRRVCQCGAEGWNAPDVDDRVRLDPLDPKTSRHAGECEYRDTTDPAVIKLILNVRPGMSEGYDWVTCNACATSWQVPHYAAESVR
jgi:hypothetical protein